MYIFPYHREFPAVSSRIIVNPSMSSRVVNSSMSSRVENTFTKIRQEEFKRRLGKVLSLFDSMDIYIRSGKLGIFPKKIAHETMCEIMTHLEFMRSCQIGTEVLYKHICEKFAKTLQQCNQF